VGAVLRAPDGLTGRHAALTHATVAHELALPRRLPGSLIEGTSTLERTTNPHTAEPSCTARLPLVEEVLDKVLLIHALED
jgi:hypothetical protein